MNKILVSLRIDPELWEWLGLEAKAAKTSRTQIIESAIKRLQGDSDHRTPVYTKPETYIQPEKRVYTPIGKSIDELPKKASKQAGDSQWGKSEKLIPRG